MDTQLASPGCNALRRGRVSLPSQSYLLTTVTHGRVPIFLNPEVALATCRRIGEASLWRNARLLCWVLMPDHWHALFALVAPWTLSKFMHDMMSFVGARTQRQISANGTRWQGSYYDTLVKTAKQFSYVADYIEQNPVAKGLVEQPDQWRASSAHRVDLVTDPWPWFYD